MKNSDLKPSGWWRRTANVVSVAMTALALLSMFLLTAYLQGKIL